MNKELTEKLRKTTDEEQEIIKNGKVDLNGYTKRKSKKISGATYFEDGDEVFFRRHPRFAEFPEHGHDYTEIMICAEGTITHRINGNSVSLGEGDVLILNKFARHSIAKTSATDLGLNILLSDKYLLGFNEKTDDDILKKFFEENFRANGSPAYIVFKSDDNLVINNLIENLVALSLSDKKHNKKRAVVSTLTALLEQVSALSKKITVCKKTNEFFEPFFESREEKYKRQIEKYVSEEFVCGSLAECARLMGINEQYLSRLTKKLFGQNFKTLLTDKRTEEGEKLLKNSDLTVSDIAAAIGYENVYGFNEAFRKKHGITPSIWKENELK